MWKGVSLKKPEILSVSLKRISYLFHQVMFFFAVVREPANDGDDDHGDDEEKENANSNGAEESSHHAVGCVDLVHIYRI